MKYLKSQASTNCALQISEKTGGYEGNHRIIFSLEGQIRGWDLKSKKSEGPFKANG